MSSDQPIATEPLHVLPEAGHRAERPHVPALDGVRGVAILLVLMLHQMIGQPVCSLDRGVAMLASTGWTGVVLFFVLSGFLITGILLDSKGARRFFLNFYARRVLRIFPLYYAMLFLSLVVLMRIVIPWLDLEAGMSALAGVRGHELWYWLYAVNFRLANYGMHGSYLDIAWSLSVEEQFYLVWPLLVWLLSPRALGWLCVVLIIGAIALRPALLSHGSDPVTVKMLTTSYLDSLALGALLAVVARSFRGLRRFASAAPRVLAVAGVAFLVAWAGHPSEWSFACQAVALPLAALCSAALLTLAYNGGRIATALTWRPLRLLGRYSYAMYLLHLPIQILARALFDPNDHVILHSVLPAQAIFCMVCTACTIAGALVSWYFLERPFLSLKRYFRDEPAAQPAPHPLPAAAH